MAVPKFQIFDHPGFRVVKFEIDGGVTTPEEFATGVESVARELPGDRVLLINGRGPVWGYGMVLHAGHPTPAVGTFDPRVGGYVVVASHDDHFRVGDVIPDPEEA